MKKLYTIILGLIAFTTLFAQAPEGLNYQAVARDGSGNVLANQNLTVKFSVIKGTAGGTAVYTEDHSVSTNDFGLFTASVGMGSAISGTFSNISWGADDYFLKVEVDDGGGYVNLGTTQFMSVPYALYAKKSGGSNSPWSSSGSNVYIGSGNVGIGTTNPNNVFTVMGNTSSKSLMHIESDNMGVLGYDIIEVEAPTGAVEGQFIEFQRGNSDIVGQVNTDGSAMFQNLELQESTSSPSASTAYANSLPIAYAYYAGIVLSTSYGVSSVTNTSTGNYEVNLENPVSGDPVVLVTTFNNVPGDEIGTYSVVDDNTILVHIANGSGTPITSNFSVVVFGTPK